MIKHAWLSYTLLLSCFFNLSLFPAVQVPAVPEGIAQDSVFAKMMQGDMGDIKKLIETLVQGDSKARLAKATAQREQFLHVLPEALQSDVAALVMAHQLCADSLKFDACCSRLCQKVHKIVQAMGSGGVLGTQLEKLHKALQSGALTDMVAPSQPSVNPTDLMSVIQSLLGSERRTAGEDLQLTLQDVRDTEVLLQALVQCEGSKAVIEVVQLLNIVQLIEKKMTIAQNLVEAMKARDHQAYATALADEQRVVRALAVACFASCEQDCRNLITDFKLMRGKLADVLICTPKEDAPAMHEACTFWIRQLRTYTQTLKSILSVSKSAHIDLSLVMKTMSQMYDIARVFFEFNRFDPATGSRVFGFLTQANLCDQILRGSIASVGFLHRYTEASSAELQKIVLSTTSVDEYSNPLDTFESEMMMGVQSLFLMLHPTAFGTVPPVKRAILRVAIALVPHLHDKAWPNKEMSLRIALFSILKELQFVSSESLKGLIIENVDAVLLEKLDTCSMGLIKPELVDLCFDLLFPIFLTQKNGGGRDCPYIWTSDLTKTVVDFQAFDTLKYEYGYLVEMAGQYGSPVGPRQAASFDIYLHNNFGYYIEYRLMQYVLKNVGFFWGSYLCKKLKNPIHTSLKSVGRGAWKVFDYFGLVERDDETEEAMLQAMSTEKTVEVDAGGVTKEVLVRSSRMPEAPSELDMIKMLVTSLFHEQSFERNWVVGFLKNNALIAEDVHDAKDVNYALVKFMTHYLVKLHLISHQQAATMFNCFLKHQDNTALFVHELFELVQENLTGAVGGMITGLIMSEYVAPKIMREHGPFFLKG